MVTVSLCMIVKNEEAVLGRCLDSICPAVDEIVIVDTGSRDETKKIAAQYTDKIYDFVWQDDFSAARNFSFSKATKDFTMWLDADDVITKEDLTAFLELKKSLSTDCDVVMMRYNTAFDEDGKPVFSYYRERLVRRAKSFYWAGRVHEAIVYSGKVQYSDAAVTHKSIKTEYSDRNLRIYEKQAANGEAMTPRDLFYYGRELYYHKQYERSKKTLQAFLSDETGWLENKIEACKILAYCYVETEEPLRALDVLFHSFRYDVPRAEVCCDIGNVFLRLQRFEIAAHWYLTALQQPQNTKSGAFVSTDCHGYIPCLQLCVCYDRLGNREKAAYFNELAGQYRPHSPQYLQNKIYFDMVSPKPVETDHPPVST